MSVEGCGGKGHGWRQVGAPGAAESGKFQRYRRFLSLSMYVARVHISFLLSITHFPWLQRPTYGLDEVVYQPGYGHVPAQGLVRGETTNREKGWEQRWHTA